MKISVVIPMYNEEENVNKTLDEVDNVLGNFSDFEIIVVDDGSTDNTYQLTNEYLSHNPKIHFLQ